MAAETAAQMSVNHPDYAILAARIAVSNLHKETKKTFSDVISDLHCVTNKHNGKKQPLVSKVNPLSKNIKTRELKGVVRLRARNIRALISVFCGRK